MENFVGILNDSEITLEIKKSKFIGLSFLVESEEDAQNKIEKIQSRFCDSTHVCYAYVLNTQEKCSDNGEPSGTAGKPMLEGIKKMGLKNVLVVVVRYFGGIKLGAGGLNRAYSDCAKTVLNASKQAEFKLCEYYNFNFNLGLEDKLFNSFYANKINIIKKYYSNFAFYEVLIEKEKVDKTLDEIANIIKRKNFYSYISEKYVKKEIID